MQKFMKAIAAIMLMVVVICAAGCKKTDDPNNGGNSGGNNNGGTEEGVYLGIIGFNDDLKTKTIDLLNANSEHAYTNFISTLDMRDGTVLYHADNKALDWLQNATLPDQLINVSLVTFTDGLDNGSTMLNNSFSTPSDYLNAVSNRIRNDRVGGKAITAYAIGLRGNDVTDYASFQQNLQKLSSSTSNCYEVENWEAVKERFRQIAIQLYNETTIVNEEVKIPGGKADGTVIRITFDNVTSPNAASQYIQGTYYRENGQGRLKNVSYHGLQSASGTEVVSERQEGIFYWYSFSDLKQPNGNPFVNTSNINLWYLLTASEWQPESEFTPETYSETSVNRKSAVTILALDCSSSLGSDFANMKEAAIEFVQLLNDYGNSNNGNGDNGGENNQYYQVSVSASAGGIATGGGSFLEGSTCTVTATPNMNYTFANWTEDGCFVSSLQSYSFTVIGNRSLVANFSNAPTGAINGKFTINSSGDQVYFSKGNLQYIGSAVTPYWKFADNQWDYLESMTGQNSTDFNVDRDLFGWGTSGYHDNSDPYNVNYQPWSTSIPTVNETYNWFGYGPSTNMPSPNLTGSSEHYDWGVHNAIFNGGGQTGLWRTLTGGSSGEWYYVFNTRNTSIRYAMAKVAGVDGVILLPDDWNTSTYSLSNTNNSGASFSSNKISASQWTTLENAGAVFLPAAGTREGEAVVGGYPSIGCYWSSSCKDSIDAYNVSFSNKSLSTSDQWERYEGLSVRLVCPAQ